MLNELSSSVIVKINRIGQRIKHPGEFNLSFGKTYQQFRILTALSH